jgi:hypothetical protein
MTTMPRRGDPTHGQGWLTRMKDGCDYHPVCTTCPFEVCRLDMDPAQLAKEARDARYLRVATLKRAGLSTSAIMAQTGMTRRTVLRAVRESKHERE